MNKFFFVLIAFVLFNFNTAVFAGGVKDVLMDAEDSIHHEFFKNGLEVITIEDQAFTPSKRGIGVKAVVMTRNPANNAQQVWRCVVDFERINNSFEPVDIHCNYD